MNALRWLAAAVTVIVGGSAVYRLAWQPFRCNIVNKRVQAAALRMWDRPSDLRVAETARRGIEEMEACIDVCVTDVDLYMTLAVNDRLIGRRAHAADMYREALKYDRRPELFFNLGVVLLEIGDRKGAEAALMQACRFNVNIANTIPDPVLADAIVGAVRARQDRAAAASRAK